MSGWLMLIAIAIAAAVLLALLRFPARMWMIPATAVTLAATGYVWQGSPTIEGHPAASEESKGHEPDPDLLAMREQLFGRFNQSYSYFLVADAMVRAGSPENAAQAMLGAVRKVPGDFSLWTWLGYTMAEKDGGMITPAARAAFDRAIAIAPNHPGPHYFLGLALIRMGQYPEARAEWAKAVALTPVGVGYRPALEEQLAKLDAFIAQASGQAMPAAEPAPEAEANGSAEMVGNSQ
ncbi:tetratricopeptide repeat protein [Sphingomonas sp.]|uniref:tetratricopeptide repeat protein n=1 Tax=Sphingomonas sp. TaxID=28214 RepID=UPI001B27F4BD|nr:tetratricopeptide repeat protein [Sphingomonas sp.]MBO9712532.1 tetratricopeptide repeat protein [Sphingomonas sp.]